MLPNAANRPANEPGVAPVIANAAGIPGRRRFAGLYMKAASDARARKARGRAPPERAGRAAGGGLRGTADRTEGIEMSAAECARFAARLPAPAADEDGLAEYAPACPNTLGAAGDLLFVAMIGEFQDALAWGGPPFLGTMRRVIQAQKSATYVFSGSAPSALCRMMRGPGAPFCRQLHDMRVAPLDGDEVGGFAAGRFAAAGIAPEAGAVDRIYGLSGGLPDHVQRPAFASYLRCIEEDKIVATKADIERACPGMLAQLGGEFGARFGAASPMERELPIALAHSKNRVGLTARSLKLPCRRFRGRSAASDRKSVV